MGIYPAYVTFTSFTVTRTPTLLLVLTFPSRRVLFSLQTTLKRCSSNGATQKTTSLYIYKYHKCPNWGDLFCNF